MKNLYFEKVKFFNKKKHIYFSDWCFSDREVLKILLKKKKSSNYVANNYWNDLKKKKNEFFLRNSINQYFNKLYKKINYYHNINYSKKYWRIVIFPWLNVIIPFIFIRWRMIESIKHKHHYKAQIYNFDEQDIIFNNFSDFKYGKDNDLWVISKIIEFKKDIKYEKSIELNLRKNLNVSLFDNLKSFFVIKLFNLFNLFFKNSFFLSNLTVNKYLSCIIYLKLKQFPFLWIKPFYKNKEINIVKRKTFLNRKTKKSFQGFLESITHILLPKSYLENFQSIKNSVLNSYLNSSYKKIITSYDYKANDEFKIWTAEMSNKGTKYYILQHGGAFGSNKFEPEEYYIKKICDKFLTWGWKDKNKNVTPFYSVGLDHKYKYLFNKNCKKILIIYHFYEKYASRISSHPNSNLERVRKNLQLKLLIKGIYKMQNNTQLSLTLRYQKGIDIFWHQEFDENYFDPYVNYDYCEKKLKNVLDNYKLVIHGSSSTTFLETMFYNCPSILILDKFSQNFRKQSKNIMDLLERQNIIFYETDKASKFINNNINNIDKWWFSDDVQILRKKFCEEYVRHTDSIFKKIKEIVK